MLYMEGKVLIRSKTEKMKLTVSAGSIIEDSIRRSISTKEQLLIFVDVIEKIAEKMVETLRRGGKIIFFGNGGSAADAQHLAAELVVRFAKERKAIAAIAITTDTSVLTAIANDYSFADIFTRQLEALLRKEDLVIAISTSGNSPNILEALSFARNCGVETVGLTGAKGTKMQDLTNLSIMVPSTETSRIQESHILVGHILCDLVEQELFSS